MKSNYKHYALKRFKKGKEETYIFDSLEDAKIRFEDFKSNKHNNLYLLSSDPELGHMVIDSHFSIDLN